VQGTVAALANSWYAEAASFHSCMSGGQMFIPITQLGPTAKRALLSLQDMIVVAVLRTATTFRFIPFAPDGVPNGGVTPAT